MQEPFLPLYTLQCTIKIQCCFGKFKQSNFISQKVCLILHSDGQSIVQPAQGHL